MYTARLYVQHKTSYEAAHTRVATVQGGKQRAKAGLSLTLGVNVNPTEAEQFRMVA